MTGVIVNGAAILAMFVVGRLAHLNPVSYGFGLLAVASTIVLAILMYRAVRRTAPRRADIANSFGHFANGIVGVCLGAWLWTAFTGALVVGLGLVLVVLSLLSITAGFITYPN